MRTIILEKPFSKCGGETIPRPFAKKSKLSKTSTPLDQNLWINSLKFHTVCSYCMPSGQLLN